MRAFSGGKFCNFQNDALDIGSVASCRRVAKLHSFRVWVVCSVDDENAIHRGFVKSDVISSGRICNLNVKLIDFRYSGVYIRLHEM